MGFKPVDNYFCFKIFEFMLFLVTSLIFFFFWSCVWRKKSEAMAKKILPAIRQKKTCMFVLKDIRNDLGNAVRQSLNCIEHRR